jgi:argonaute-like protein implicated in RNA metabolism and viral defense
MQNQNYFYIIPAELAEGGNATKALLFGLLTSLADKRGFCYASNGYLAEKIGKKSASIIREYLTELEAENWIIISEREAKARKIYIGVKRATRRKNGRLPAEKTAGQPAEKTAHSNISRVIEDSKLITNVINCDEQKKTNKTITDILEAFKKINPSVNYGNKTQRKACENLIGVLGDKVLATTAYAISVQGQRYAPTITTPYQLFLKLTELKIFYEKSKLPNKGAIDFSLKNL